MLARPVMEYDQSEKMHKFGWYEIKPGGYVQGMLASREVCLEFRPQKDITAYELYVCERLFAGMVSGNKIACIIEEKLIRHFKEVDMYVEKEQACEDTQLLAGRVASTTHYSLVKKT